MIRFVQVLLQFKMKAEGYLMGLQHGDLVVASFFVKEKGGMRHRFE